MIDKIPGKQCRVCGHSKEQHKSHIGPDYTGQKIKHISCNEIVKRSEIDMHEFGISSIGHRCSCDGFKPNTSLKRAIKEISKISSKTLDPTITVDNLYKRKEIKSDAINKI